jgi:nitrite reductase/ring-hydroxylating ferredoxin subunit
MTENPARPPSGTTLCALADLADPGAKGFRYRAADKLFAGFVVRTGDAVAGWADSCPHAGWPLSSLDERYLTRDGRHVLCAGHGALFRPLDGACVAGPCMGERLTPWPVTVVDGTVVTA